MDYKHEEVKITSSPGQAPGTARIAFEGQPLASYAETTAGTLGTWTVEFTVGEGGIPEGGGIALWWPNQGFRFSVRQQGIYPERRGYATVETTGSARLDLRVNSRDPGHSLPLVVAQVREASLLDGDVVTFRFNDRSGGSPGGLTYLNVALGIRLHVGVDGDASGRFVEISGSPLAISVFADRGPRRYVALVPSTTSVGLSSTVQVVALDRCGNLAPGAAAQLGVESPNCGGLPEKFHLSYLDGGVKRLEKVSFPEGISRIRVIDRERGIEAVSNPVRCEPRPEFHVYWGDIHNHAYDRSLWLDLTPATDPDANYRYGRDVSRLDFCSLNCHLYLEHGYDGQEEAWKTVQECAARFHEPGKYVTFSGFEYHGMGGDRCMILNGDVVPRAELRDLYGGNTRRALESEGDIQRMFDFAAHTGSMVTCHVGGNPTDFSYHDPRAQWSVEMASMHGNFEWFGVGALQKGLRVGFHEASDGHVQTPGHPRRPGSGGRNGDLNRRDTGYASGALMGVLARELTRDGLFEAFQARRTYATTSARILLDFRVNGHHMGEEIDLEGPPSIRADVVGTAPIERLELIGDDRLLHTGPGGSDHVGLEFTDDSCSRGDHYYYLRVSQEDGETAWSSPIWVHRSDGPAGDANTLPLWNDDDPESRGELSPEDAERYERILQDYLSREEDATRWESLQAIRVVDAPMGRYALLFAHDRKHEKPVHFKLFLDYDDVVLRMDLGRRDFGQYQNRGTEAFADYHPDEGARSIQ